MATTNLDNKTITIEYDAEVPQPVCKAASVLPVFYLHMVCSPHLVYLCLENSLIVWLLFINSVFLHLITNK